jgi:tetratricopeptide (TPR) repeat protein
MSNLLESEGRYRAIIALAWLTVCVVVAVVYWPGLGGPWLFDDYGSVRRLGDFGGVRDWETFKSFVFGGTAGPTGRPIALLSFLIDGQDWPTDAWPFKRTNLVIHILSGVLLGVFVRQLLLAVNVEAKKAAQIALVTAACWMLHPYLVSTTLYVVQRMAQLAALFVFAGLSGYVYGRRKLQTSPVAAYLIMSLSVVVFTVLAALCKENGILLPLLAGTVELTVFSGCLSGRLHRYWLVMFLVVPALAIFLYLGNRAVSSEFFTVVHPRDFSIYERLLTQPRVVADYLQNWFVPKLYTTGVFQDHFIKSTGLLTPITTFLAAIMHVGLIIFALVSRRRFRLISLAILFYYSGHLLESTVLNLELYFEHRNYLPAALLFLPAVVFLREQLDSKKFVLVSIGILLLLGSFTRYSATIWQDYDQMIATSASKAPSSARAMTLHAGNLYNEKKFTEAVAVLDLAEKRTGSGKALVLINRAIILCYMKQLTPAEFERISGRLQTTTFDSRSLRLYTRLTEAILDQECPSVSAEALGSLFERMAHNPANSDPQLLRYAHLHYLSGYVQAHIGQSDKAVEHFRKSLDSRPDPSSAMDMAARLATNNHHAAALEISEVAMHLLQTVGARAGSSVTEEGISVFQDVVRADLAAEQEADTSDPAE